MTETIIYSITEAFSMQPATHYVGEQIYRHGRDVVTIVRIVEGTVVIDGDPYTYYMGLDEQDNRLFEYKKGTVNVEYQVLKQ